MYTLAHHSQAAEYQWTKEDFLQSSQWEKPDHPPRNGGEADGCFLSGTEETAALGNNIFSVLRENLSTYNNLACKSPV